LGPLSTARRDSRVGVSGFVMQPILRGGFARTDTIKKFEVRVTLVRLTQNKLPEL